MRRLLFLFPLLLALTAGLAEAAPPLLVLDVARFRNEDMAVRGGVLEIYATVSAQSLTYKRRAPKVFQAAATLTLEVLRLDGSAAYQEIVTLKPPVLSDTSIALKNPVSFQKRVALPDGNYVVRAQVRDQYRAGNVNVVDLPVVLDWKAPTPLLSDVVLLAKPAAKSLEQSNFMRGGFSLSRAPGGLYPRGAERLFFYAELYNLAADQKVQLRYRLRPVAGSKDVLTGTGAATGIGGRSTPVVGEMDLSKLPAGEYTLTVEARDAKNKLLSGQTTRLRRTPADYAPAGAALPR